MQPRFLNLLWVRSMRPRADHKQDRIRMDHLLEMAVSFRLEFSEGSDTQL